MECIASHKAHLMRFLRLDSGLGHFSHHYDYAKNVQVDGFEAIWTYLKRRLLKTVEYTEVYTSPDALNATAMDQIILNHTLSD